MNNIIEYLDRESPKQIAKRINIGEFTLSELNDSLVETLKGVTNEDHASVNKYLKRAEKLDSCIVYLD